jgi:serine/threonine protein kinase
MHDVSAFDRALVSASRPGAERPDAAPSLAGLECFRNHPGREGLGPAIEKEMPEGHVLDGRFIIREVVGRSAMATVYRVEDSAAGGRSVAIKVPLVSILSDPVLFGRFEREEQVGSKLSHPLLLKYIPVEGPRSRPYIAMEYLDGCTLAYILHLTRPLPENDALRIASVVCDALVHLHARGVIHRDLKPSNIMICRDCTLRIMDFGLVEELDVKRGILAGWVPLFGTPEYMAPEQVRNARNDARTDIYSLGVILYQMLAGALPFQGADPWAAAQMRVTGDPEAPRRLNPELSAQSEEIVLHAMRRKPDERYPTAAAFRAELDDPERVHVTGLSLRLRAPRWRLSLEGTPILSGLLIGVGVLLLLAVFVYFAVHHMPAHGR